MSPRVPRRLRASCSSTFAQSAARPLIGGTEYYLDAIESIECVLPVVFPSDRSIARFIPSSGIVALQGDRGSCRVSVSISGLVDARSGVQSTELRSRRTGNHEARLWLLLIASREYWKHDMETARVYRSRLYGVPGCAGFLQAIAKDLDAAPVLRWSILAIFGAH